MTVDDNKAYDDINVTPMVDLYLVLLLIFIIMTTAGVQGTKVALPKGSKAPAIGGPKSKAITINNEGKVFLDTVPVTLAAGKETIQDLALSPDTTAGNMIRNASFTLRWLAADRCPHRILYRRRARPAERKLTGSLRRAFLYRATGFHVDGAGTGTGPHQPYGGRTQRQRNGQRTRLDESDRTDRCNARARHGSQP